MRTTIIFLFALLSGGYFTLAQAAEADLAERGASAPAATRTVTTPAEAATDAPRRGTLYQVRYQDTSAWLFGTIHLGHANFFPLEPIATRALRDAHTLFLEADVRDTQPILAAIRKYGLLTKPGDTLEQNLSPDTRARLRRTLERTGIAAERLAPLAPWMAAMLIGVSELRALGLSEEFGSEQLLLKEAVRQGKNIEAFETIEYQMALFGSLSLAQQELLLRDVLNDINDGTARVKAGELVRAWSQANGPVIERLYREAIGEKNFTAAFTRDTLLALRNPPMAQRIEAALKSGRSGFVAVGYLHLLGEQGLPQLLKARGYEVRKLY